jgi:hypothetical protein
MNPSINEMIDVGCQRPGGPVQIWLARQRRHVLGLAVGIGEGFCGVGGNSLDAADAIVDTADRR